MIRLNKLSNTSFTPPASKTKPTAINAIITKPMSLENSRLKPKYKPITTIASNTSDWALLKNQLYKFYPKFISHSSLSSKSFVRLLVC